MVGYFQETQRSRSVLPLQGPRGGCCHRFPRVALRNRYLESKKKGIKKKKKNQEIESLRLSSKGREAQRIEQSRERRGRWSREGGRDSYLEDILT